MREEYLKLDQILKKKIWIRYGVMNDTSHRFLRHENISQLAPASSFILISSLVL